MIFQKKKTSGVAVPSSSSNPASSSCPVIDLTGDDSDGPIDSSSYLGMIYISDE
jgi:hypothetical protein